MLWPYGFWCAYLEHCKPGLEVQKAEIFFFDKTVLSELNTKILLSLKENHIPTAVRKYTLRLCYSNWGKRDAARKIFLPLFCHFKSWMTPVKWLRLLRLISVTEGCLPKHPLDSFIDRCVFYHLVQSSCTSAVPKNIFIWNKTPPNWSKSFCPRKQWYIHQWLTMSFQSVW